MLFQILGFAFGLVMALHYYVLLVFLPALLDAFLGED